MKLSLHLVFSIIILFFSVQSSVIEISKDSLVQFIADYPLSVIFIYKNNETIQNSSNVTETIVSSIYSITTDIVFGSYIDPEINSSLLINLYSEDKDNGRAETELFPENLSLNYIVPYIIYVYNALNIKYLVDEDIASFNISIFDQDKYGIIIFNNDTDGLDKFFHQNVSFEIKDNFDVFSININSYDTVRQLFDINQTILFEEESNDKLISLIIISYHPQSNSTIIIHFKGDYTSLFDVIMKYSFPQIIDFASESNIQIINAIKQASTTNNFFLLVNQTKDEKEILDKYLKIAETFHQTKPEIVWFTYIDVDKSDYQNISTPICFYYENIDKNYGEPNLDDLSGHYTTEISQKGIEAIFNFQNKPKIEEIRKIRRNPMHLFEDEDILLQYSRFVVFYYEKKNYNTPKYFQFKFMLERFSYLLEGYNIPFVEISVEKSKREILVNVPEVETDSIVLFTNAGKGKEYYSYYIYDKGLSISTFSKYFNAVFDIKFELTKEETINYYEELMSDNDYLPEEVENEEENQESGDKDEENENNQMKIEL